MSLELAQGLTRLESAFAFGADNDLTVDWDALLAYEDEQRSMVGGDYQGGICSSALLNSLSQRLQQWTQGVRVREFEEEVDGHLISLGIHLEQLDPTSQLSLVPLCLHACLRGWDWGEVEFAIHSIFRTSIELMATSLLGIERQSALFHAWTLFAHLTRDEEEGARAIIWYLIQDTTCKDEADVHAYARELKLCAAAESLILSLRSAKEDEDTLGQWMDDLLRTTGATGWGGPSLACMAHLVSSRWNDGTAAMRIDLLGDKTGPKGACAKEPEEGGCE